MGGRLINAQVAKMIKIEFQINKIINVLAKIDLYKMLSNFQKFAKNAVIFAYFVPKMQIYVQTAIRIIIFEN